MTKRDETWEATETTPTAPRVSLSLHEQDTGEILGRMPDQGLLGRGAMGEIRRVHDPILGRDLALKLLPLTASTDHEERFRAEARITAQLQHPGIVPIFALGRLADGRLGYAMQIVRGQTLLDWLAAQEPLSAPGLRRRMDVLLRICEAVAYAHGQGIVHRDLKPQNVMLGAFGEVQVLDWGIAVEAGYRGPPAGTPAWMAPEQAAGREIQTSADVWALGAVLNFLLSGQRIWSGNAVAKMNAGMHPELLEMHGLVPEELLRLRARCLTLDPAARPPDASHLVAELTAFLEGARRREEAERQVEEADRLLPTLEALERQAEEARARAVFLLRDLPPHAPIQEKQAGWEAEEEAAHQELEAERLRFSRNRLLFTALEIEPRLAAAHARLADHFMREHAVAEARRDIRAAREAERNLRIHDQGRYARWLRGESMLAIRTDPPGAEVTVHAWEERQRRLVAGGGLVVGRAPLEINLPAGPWLITLALPDRPVVRLPILLERGLEAPQVEEIPIPAAWPEGCAYVPPGWFWSGGDPEAVDATPRRRHWLCGFFLQRHPVTVGQWLAFLRDLDRRGDPALPERMALRPGTDRPMFGRGPDGQLCCDTVHIGLQWQEDWPMMQVSRDDALAYARWRAARDGRPWRLPHGLEREKAARGPDGRRLPWGDHFDPALACVQQSHPGRPAPVPVHAFPYDEGPYGARWLAGGISEWCLEGYDRAGDPEGEVRPAAPAQAAAYIVRGGWWGGQSRTACAASRSAAPGDRRFDATGFRLLLPLAAPGADAPDARPGATAAGSAGG